MQYRTDEKSKNQLSILGFGCMRFPRNLTTQTDMKKTERLIMKAVENGVNYFDCAYIYGGSEETLGTVLDKNGVREKVYIATKLPLMKCAAYEDFDKLFETQLQRLRTGYIDYYLMHNLSDMGLWKELCALGIEKWISEKKAGGQIKQAGFSFHGTQNEFMALLDAYNWDFVQIQYNYVNINYQAGQAGLQKAAKMGMPVMVMEPLLGGKLANGLPKKAKELFLGADANLSFAARALCWLWNQKEVTVVLSGMNDGAQLDENLKTAEKSAPDMFTNKENDVFAMVAEAFGAFYKIPCTGCNYCMPCPKNVNIPGCFAAYNMSYAVGMISAVQLYATSTGGFSPQKDYSAGQCVKCGACEKKCPQHLSVMKDLKEAHKTLISFKWDIP
ncbi:MAG: aldo/keto reductase [Oscillospiraceae bacterium]|nr:aldo/keto reductase [Oscillospiraceae bacterium]